MNQELTAITEIDSEAPHAVVNNQHITELPDDLYIPPDALHVFLETFEGPLDLLLYLIRKQSIDVLDIPIASVTRQYMEYIEQMRELHFELAAEYLVMAAMLTEIKSRLLLPRPLIEEEGEEGDPRAELVRRLQEYERFKQAADCLEAMPRVGRDIFIAEAFMPQINVELPQPLVSLEDLLHALGDVIKRSELYTDHQVERDVLSVQERMAALLSAVTADTLTEFTRLFIDVEGRMGVVVTVIAILELVRQKMIEFVQSEPYAMIYIKAK